MISSIALARWGCSCARARGAFVALPWTASVTGNTSGALMGPLGTRARRRRRAGWERERDRAGRGTGRVEGQGAMPGRRVRQRKRMEGSERMEREGGRCGGGGRREARVEGGWALVGWGADVGSERGRGRWSRCGVATSSYQEAPSFLSPGRALPATRPPRQLSGSSPCRGDPQPLYPSDAPSYLAP